MGDITSNDISYNGYYLKLTLLITVNKKHKCNVTFISVTSKVFISIVIMSFTTPHFLWNLRMGLISKSVALQ
jgi:hypothetical protein